MDRLEAMFTGLVQITGEVVAMELSDSGTRLTVLAPEIAPEAALGESIAVNGCCLTVAAKTGTTLTFDLLRETLARTDLGDARPGSLVNLERALAFNGRLGGHFVQGHIDCVGEVLEYEAVGADFRLEVALPAEFARYVVNKGSLAVDGISLTVAELGKQSAVLWIIPHTRTVTNLRERCAGDRVNLEFDLLAKYVERLLPMP
jgi:riboflavin synthase